MYNLMIGQPGGGKSYEANVFHILPALKRGRKVITNLPVDIEFYAALDPAFRELLEVRRRPQPIRGTWTVGNDEPAYTLFEDGHTEDPPAGTRAFAGVWDYWTDWKHPKGMGPLYVIDECHLVLPRVGTHPHVEEWYSLHRHFNADALLITQSYGKMSGAIRDSVQLVYRVKKAIAFGTPNHYIRKVQDGIRGEVVNTESRKYEKQFFPLYRSHTQGESAKELNADDVVPLWKHWSFKGAALCLLLIGCIVAFGDIRNPFGPGAGGAKAAAKAKERAEAVKTAVTNPNPQGMVGKPTAVQPQAEVEKADPDPYEGKGLHLTGHMKMGTKERWEFVVSQNGQRVAVTSDSELRSAGYAWRGAGDCIGWLTFGKSVRAITCDSPQIAPTGSNTQPAGTAQGSAKKPDDHHPQVIAIK